MAEQRITLYNNGNLETIKLPAPAPIIQQNSGLRFSNAAYMANNLVEIENPRNIWGFYTDELSDLNPDRIKFYLEAARLGVNWWKSSLFEELRRKDLRIGGLCQTRKYAVAKKAWEIAYPDEIAKEDDPEQKMIIEFMKENVKRTKPASTMANMVEAQLQGVSTFEINYDIFANKIGIKNIRYIQNHILLYDDKDDMYLYMDPAKNDLLILNPLTANTIQDRYDVKQIAIPNIAPAKILEVHALDGNAQNGFQNGCIDSLIWAFYLKNYGLKDFGMYIERLGIPALIAKYDPLMNGDERSVLYNAIKNWGRLFKLMVPNTANVDLLTDQTKSQTGNLFKDYISYFNDECSIRILGQTLTTSIGDNGSRAAAEVHDTVREDLVEADMTVVTEAYNELIERLGKMNFPGKLLPEFRFKERANVDYQVKRSSVYKNIKDAGWRVTKETVESEMELQVEDEPLAPVKNNNTQPEEKKPDTKPEDDKNNKQEFTDLAAFHKVKEKEVNDFLDRIFNKG